MKLWWTFKDVNVPQHRARAKRSNEPEPIMDQSTHLNLWCTCSRSNGQMSGTSFRGDTPERVNQKQKKLIKLSPHQE
ncbi:hypothetical protein BLOT_014317 [Blomia tropicalis]|nr:hypothetical protein BLOT_014317 [Blomia tropicalis]